MHYTKLTKCLTVVYKPIVAVRANGILLLRSDSEPHLADRNLTGSQQYKIHLSRGFSSNTTFSNFQSIPKLQHIMISSTTGPFTITREEFEASNSAAVYGTRNPSIMENRAWKYMISTRSSAWGVRVDFTGVSGFPKNGPEWCFSRFGQTTTVLPEGRIVFIAGEHEDGYDPDFFIYNDVIVFGKEVPENEEDITIYGYPKEVFLPTDNHTATYCPGYECIYIVGGLGYMDGRHRKEVLVHCLDLGDFSMREVKTKGEKPGAHLSKHTAELIPGENGKTGMIRVTMKGEVEWSSSDPDSDVENELDEDNPEEDGPEEDEPIEKNESENSEPAEEPVEETEDTDYPSGICSASRIATLLEYAAEDRRNLAAEEIQVDPDLAFAKVYYLDLDTFVWTFENADIFP